MHRAVPVSNKILQRRWEEHTQEVHSKKLRSVKSSIDASQPVSLSVPKSRAKKEQMMEDRYLEIERENRLLLGKMTQIMHSTSFKGLPYRQKRSLNVSIRKRDLIKITLENQALLKRLTEKQPCYRVDKWEDDRVETEKLLDNICEYPYQLGITREHRTRAASRELSSSSGFSKAMRKSGMKLGPLRQKRSVFKQGVKISGRLFLVEMTTDLITFTVTVSDVKTPDRHVLDLPYKDAVALMGAPDAYEALVKMFHLDDSGELVLRPGNPLSSSFSEKMMQAGRSKPPGANSASPKPRTSSAQGLPSAPV